ncbi:DUF5348 domain-containing protein [Acetobacterium bakii]|uniref:DUF5348 domain-containing protein n=1 Tax=Acetobacterium bakii TaxID=52689 RepID=A0A0L6TYW1_9FIRM|nr:DUF5348 domain-containing protein [Acetobacterium bakii]KNZ41449.1 hypothetical protein AKG39_11815 [Acetobacterium bakii]
MNYEYMKARDIISKAHYELEDIFKHTEPENMTSDFQSLENREARDTLEKVIGCLDIARDHLEYLNSPIKEGVLEEDSRTQKFFIIYDDRTESYNFGCGSSLELFINGEWIIGRVEANQEGEYYFYGAGRPLLFRGMRVRKRTNH